MMKKDFDTTARKMELLVAVVRHEYETAANPEVSEALELLLAQTVTARNKIRGSQPTGSTWEWAIKFSVLVPEGEGSWALGTVPA
jgi:hypothetical protein